MEYRKFADTYVVRINQGEEILEQLRLLSEAEHIKLAHVSAIGAIGDFTVGLFRKAEKQYVARSFQGDYEIVSLSGTVNTMNGAFYTHLHLSAADESNHVFGGHLNRAVVSATCEMIVRLILGTVDRQFSEEIGLNLLSFS